MIVLTASTGRRVDFTENELIIEGKSVKVPLRKIQKICRRDLGIGRGDNRQDFFTDKDGVGKHLTHKRVVTSGPIEA